MPNFKIAVIGAGSSGLTAIKQCLDDKLDVICFEKNPHIGGLWKYVEINGDEDPHSSVYKNFPIPYDWPTYLPNSMVAKYYEMYAEHFKLHKYIKFDTSVLNVSLLPDKKWNIKYIAKGEGVEKEEIFDYVMVCTGHHHKYKLPKYKGMDIFAGQQLHSHFYRRPSPFEDKRVIVVGVGNSGMDISVELSHVASQVYLISRRGKLPWIIPRLVMGGTPIDHLKTRFNSTIIPSFLSDFVTKTIIKMTIGAPPSEFRPKTQPSQAHPSVKSDFYERMVTGTIKVKPNIEELLPGESRSVRFVDGTVVENIDAIIYATGYLIDYPFLDKEIINGGEKISSQFEEEYRENLSWMYKFIFPPNYPNIAFIGLIQQIGAVMPISEVQSRWVTSMIKGYAPPLPSVEEMNKSIGKYHDEIRKKYYSSSRHTIQSEMMPYIDDLAKRLNFYPYSLSILKKYGLGTLFNVWFGLPSPIQYRLIGRQSWEGAPEALRKINERKSKKSKSSKSLIFALIVILFVFTKKGYFNRNWLALK
ncbi:12475_t:CDS:2 [Entrophospora sp. SA101]|nr:12475_t:CDS:2 [Entrophospora sp. SA101]